VEESCSQGNESSSTIKRREFLDELSDYKFLNQDSATCSKLVTD
jgi:hypothetical protein